MFPIKKSIRGPVGGYLTDVKDVYRKTVYSEIKNIVGKADMNNKKLLCLPANHGAEIKEALSIGIREENIYACDDNPAMLATAKWRKDFPQVNVLGSRLCRAIERLANSGIRIDIINLDLCCNLTQEMFDDVSACIRSFCVPEMILCLTLLKGRESSSETTLARMLYSDQNGIIDRLSIVFNFVLTEFEVTGKIFVNNEYKSNTQKMVYGIFHFINNRFVLSEMEKMFDSLHGEVLANLAIDKKFHSLIKPCFQRGYARLTAVQADKKNKDYYRQLQTLQDIYWHDAREIENKMKNTRAHDLLDMVRAYAGYARKHEIVIPRFHSKSVSSYMEMISMPNHNFRN